MVLYGVRSNSAESGGYCVTQTRSSSWTLAIIAVIVYNVALTVITWSLLKEYGYVAGTLSPMPVGIVTLGATTFQTALYKLGKR
jgi:hypothetical protein